MDVLGVTNDSTVVLYDQVRAERPPLALARLPGRLLP
jgi:hypothetical protein